MASNTFSDIKKYLESLSSDELKSFLESPCSEPEYEGLSNAQSLYRKMLENDTYLLDKKEEAERLLNDIKTVFGEKLYTSIYAVLKSQQEQKTAAIKASAPPVLYHGSTSQIEKFEPRLNTCQFGLYTDKMVFASESLDKNAMYPFREAHRSDGHKATSLVTAPIETPFGKKRIVIASQLQNNGYMYKLPSETFIPVVRLDGFFNHEWISFSEVKPKEVEKTTLQEAEEKYKFLSFTFPNIEKEEEFLKNLKSLKTDCDQKGYPAVEELVQQGILIPLTKPKEHNLPSMLSNIQKQKSATPPSSRSQSTEI